MTAVEQRDRFGGRATTVLYLIAGVFAIGVIVALAAPASDGDRLLVATAMSVNALYAAWIATAVRSGVAWARPVAILVLWFLVVAGIVNTIVAMSQGRLDIPIGTLLAAYALAAPAGPIELPASGPDRGRALQAITVGAVIAVAPILLALVARGL